MDLPPSGWYPDPYGMPDLLRWWDGSVWTQHTHPGGAAGGTGTDSSGGGATASAQQAGGQQAGGQQAGPWQETARQAAGQASAGQASAGQVSADRLSRTRPPTGQPTQPQPALPATTVQQAVRPTAYQPAVTAVQQPVQPTAVQPPIQPTAVQPPARPAGPGAGQGDAGGTQVLFLGGDSWQPPGGPGGPAGPGGPPQGGRYGYQAAQRRRRMWLMGGLAGAAVAAVALIAALVAALGGSPAPTAAQAPAGAAAAAPAASAATASASPSPSPSPSASDATAAVLSDDQSGLAYALLSPPWQPVCPGTLDNGAFTWTAGESAIAGQVNDGQSAWYGDACSGPLPQQYGYTGVPDLASTATNLASTFQAAYYTALNHTVTPGVSQPVQVSGHPGWEVTFQVSYPDAAAQGATWTDEQAAVVVADAGPGNPPAVFYTSIPATLGETNVAMLVSSLQLSVVPPLGGAATPAPAAPASGATSPAPAAPGNGNGFGNGNHP